MSEKAEEKLDALVARVTRVRRWLVVLAVLKVAALCLVFVSVYVGVYAWLDHRRNFDEVGRIIAFVLLVTGLALLFYRLTKCLLVHVSCSEAANYIENINSFNQQLVTAIEYYENKQNYPYSRVLAEELVLNVDKDSEGLKFDSTVEKWKGYALSAVILIGIGAVCFYVHDNYVYFSSYFARLIRPLASVEPLSQTSLETITKDIITKPGSEVTFSAEVKGRVPESGKLVVVNLEPQTEGDIPQAESEQMQVKPVFDGDKTPKFEASKSFSQTGRFKYRFEAGSASTDWNKLTVCEPPGIEGITADVALPRRPPRRKWIKPYTEQIEDNNLEVIQGSDVTLNVQVADKVEEVTVTGPDGRQFTKRLDGAQEFSYSFNAEASGFIKFQLVNEQGLANDDVPDLEVRVKTDEPAKFKLVCPEGDYLATDVASVPVIFEVTDDFGLSSVEMFVEAPGQQPEELVVVVEEGTRSKIFTHIIELENYNLNVGDSVLFYAQATDIDTGSAVEQRTSRSDVHFIEIRPYRQNWRPRPGGGPSPGGVPPPVELLNILEYTRAIVKKTWTIAGKPYLSEQDRSRLEFINNDVEYCAEQLAIFQDDPEYGFNDSQKAVLKTVIENYGQAGRYLAEHNAASAIIPEKNTYRILRKFILEMDLELKPPESGQGQKPPRPDSINLQEKEEFSQEDKERIEAELRKLQQRLKKVTREQKVLNRTFVNFLEQQSRQDETAQQMNDSKPSSPDDKMQPQKSGGQDKQQSEEHAGQKSDGSSGSSGAESQSASESQGTSKGETASDSSKPGDDEDTVESEKATRSQSINKGKSFSKTTSAGDKQNAATSQRGSKGRRSEEAQTISDSPNAGDKKDSAEGKRVSRSSKDGSPSDSLDAAGKQNTSGKQGESKGQSSGKEGTASNGQKHGGGKDIGEEQSDLQSKGSSQKSNSAAQARLRMLQAKQRALQEQVSQLKDDLQSLPEVSESGGSQGRAEAQKHLGEAIAKMDDFQERLNEARYESDMDERKTNEAVQLMESALNQMDLAKESLDNELILSDEERLAQKAQEMAEQLADDAEALDESVTPLERADMLARLEAAKRLLEQMPEPQWATIKNKADKGTSSTAAVFTKNPNLSSAETARQLARQFWSISINAKKYRQQLIEDEPSDVKFYGQENEFFENAAKYEQEAVKK